MQWRNDTMARCQLVSQSFVRSPPVPVSLQGLNSPPHRNQHTRSGGTTKSSMTPAPGTISFAHCIQSVHHPSVALPHLLTQHPRRQLDAAASVLTRLSGRSSEASGHKSRTAKRAARRRRSCGNKSRLSDVGSDLDRFEGRISLEPSASRMNTFRIDGPITNHTFPTMTTESYPANLLPPLSETDTSATLSPLSMSSSPLSAWPTRRQDRRLSPHAAAAQVRGELLSRATGSRAYADTDRVSRSWEQKQRVAALRTAAERAVYAEEQQHSQGSCSSRTSSPRSNCRGESLNQTGLYHGTRSDAPKGHSLLASVPAPPTARPAFVTLADFEVKGTLGTGTFGRVLLVKLRHQGRRHSNSRGDNVGPTRECDSEDEESAPGYLFALKALDKGQLVKMKQVEHANSERNILARISHPFVVNLKATFQDTKCIYLLMDFAMGGEVSFLRASRDKADQQ